MGYVSFLFVMQVHNIRNNDEEMYAKREHDLLYLGERDADLGMINHFASGTLLGHVIFLKYTDLSETIMA